MYERACHRCDVDISQLTDDEYYACSLCDPCKEIRPTCKYCQKLVDEVDEENEQEKEFEQSHWMCIQNDRKQTLDLGWRKYADIDWDMFQNWMQKKYIQIFEQISNLVYEQNEAHLVVITGINGGLCFNLQLDIPDSDRILFSDLIDDWYDVNDKISETFSMIDCEVEIEDDESEEDYERILKKIEKLTLNGFLKYQNNNFNFDPKVKVTWRLYES